MPTEAGARLGPCEIEEAIGAGGMARSTGRAIPASSDETFKAGLPETLFDAALFPLMIRNRYSVTDDGERFLLLSPITGESIRPISVVLNWQAGLEP